VYFCFWFFLNVVAVHLIPYANDTGISLRDAAKIAMLRMAVGIPAKILIGAVSDRVGTKKVIAISFALIALSMLWLQIANTLWMFFVYAALTAIATSGPVVMASIIVAELFGIKEHGSVLGVAAFVWTFGSVTGPIVGGWFFDLTNSYRIPFFISAGLSLLGLIVMLFIKPIYRANIIRKKTEDTQG
jgi:AAHS family benzoate transporter-like MFS transporter